MFFRLRTAAGNTWPPLPEPALAQLWTLYQELDRTQWLPAQEIEQRQLAQARALLAHGVTQVPHYRQALSAIGMPPASIQSLADFRRLPILTRAAVQAQLAVFQAAALPTGTTAAGSMRTAGTTGARLTVAQTGLDQLWWYASTLRDLEWSGFDPTGRLAALEDLESTEVQTPVWLPLLQPLLEMGPRFAMKRQLDAGRQFTWLRRAAPDYLTGTPSELGALAALIEKGGQTAPRLRAIQAHGEPLTEQLRAAIEAAFRAPVRNLYRCAEGGIMASSCPAGHGLHVHAENVLLEVLDDRGQPCAPGQVGRVHLTTLHSLQMPFVRYDLGDWATQGPERCPCGRGLPLLLQVHGRVRPTTPITVTADRRAGDVSPLVEASTGGLTSPARQRQDSQASHLEGPTMPGHAWPSLPQPATGIIWAALQTMRRNEWLEPAEIEQQQLAQVRTLLAHAASEVPYYTKSLQKARIRPDAIKTMRDFRRVPILPRRVVREQAQALVARRLPAGMVATGQRSTSGSTGVPVTALQTGLVDLWWYACYLRDLEWAGFDLAGVLASIRATGQPQDDSPALVEGLFQSRWLPQLPHLIETGPHYLLDLHTEHRRQLAWLRRIDPDYVLSYPSNLEVLARLVQEEGARLPRLRGIQVISDTLSDEGRSLIESGFGVPVKNLYSCCEAGYLASPCPEGHGLHVHAENVLIEMIDDDGQPCGPGQTGRVLVTALQNYRSPFIRYDLGDLVTLDPERCACGRGLPLLASVLGKKRAMFRLADGRIKSSSGTASILRQVGGHIQHQLIQKALDHVVVRLVPDRNWSEAHAARLVRALQGFFEAPVRVDVQIEERLELPRGGKFQNMICEL